MQFLKFELQRHVVILTLNDPATRNALTGETAFAAFEDAVDQMNADLNIRAAILTGEGTAFCSGGNIADMRDKKGMFAGTPPQIESQYRSGIQRIPKALSRLDVPLIAAVNGPAIGAGCDLACMCDIRIASEKASFAESFVKVGIIAGDGGAWLLPRIIGYARAAEMAAETAKQRGIPVATDVDQLRARAKRGLSKLSDTTAVPLTASSAPVAESNVDPLAIPSILCGVQGCGHPNPGNAPFCRHCGARLVRSVSHQQDSREAEAENER